MGLVDAERASMYEMFICRATEGRDPVKKQPNTRPSPTAISPSTISQANQFSSVVVDEDV